MAEIVVGPVVEQVSEHLVRKIGRQLGYLFHYRSNVAELNEQVGRLSDARVRLQQSVDEANRQGHEIFPDVHKWLNDALEKIQETEEFCRREREENIGCFNLKLRYQRSKKAKNWTGDIREKIQEDERIQKKGVSHPPPPPPVIRSSSLIGYEALESRASTLNQIMEALRSDDIRMIGVWGMGGVGKTTHVKQVAKQADEDSIFDKVVIAYVSQVPNLASIQGEIAVTLGLKFEGGGDEAGKANRLRESLKKHKKILVILDDIWEKVDLGKIGIPLGDDHRGCKILLTSRSFHLLSIEMGSQKNFSVEHLGEEEAWSLFKKTAGDSVEKPELNSTATEVAKKCAGLPIAIVTVAKALKDEPLRVWKEASRQLTRSIKTDIAGIEDKTYLSLELSYNRLKSNKAKSLFLLCGFLDYGDTPIDRLLRYGMGLDLFDEEIDTLEDATNSLHTVIQNLKGASLLLESGDGDTDEFVRMHDVVRQVARVIASEDPHRFVVKDAVELQQRRMWDGCRNCTRISLKCRNFEELPEGLVCPNLEFFVLNSDRGALEIPDTWFDETKGLKVLGLSNVHLTPLPSSLRLLSNLRTLCLEGCIITGDIAIIGELKKLQIVSFVGSRIEQLPKEMMQLSDLRVLDLRGCSVLRVIPQNVISSLSRLEYLCTGFFREWEGGGVNNGESNASLSELKHLLCLRYLDVGILHSDLLPQDLVFDNLDRFSIWVGDFPYFNLDRFSRSLSLCEVTRIQQVNCFSKLLKRTESLYLHGWRLQGVKHDLCELDKEGFVELKYLSIRECDEIEYVGNTMEGVPPTTTIAFPILEDLIIHRLSDLEAVWHGPIRMGSFGNLRSLYVVECEKLKYVIVLPIGQGTETLVFPQLETLTLRILPELLSFNSIGATTATKESLTIFNHQDVLDEGVPLTTTIAFPILENLFIDRLSDLEAVWHGPIRMGSFGNLRSLRLWNCEKLKYVIVLPMAQGTETLVFPRLQELTLRELPKLLSFNSNGTTTATQESVTIFNHQVILAKEDGMETLANFVFPKLTHLALTNLRELKNFYLGKHTSKWPLLKELKIYNCEKLETLFQDISLKDDLDGPTQSSFFLIEKDVFPNLEKLELGLKDSINIWRDQFSRESFSKLGILKIRECHAILVAIPYNMVQRLHNLRYLSVSRCNSMKEVIQATSIVEVETLPQLTIIYLNCVPKLKHLCAFGLEIILQNLQILVIEKCKNLITLLTPSMVKKFLQLQALVISECNMVEEMFGNKEGHEATDDIVFAKLQRLMLRDLPNLTSFCSASYTFKFPFLKYIVVSNCPKMDAFCEGGFSAPTLKNVEMDDEELDWEDDLNMAIHNKYMEKNGKEDYEASEDSVESTTDSSDPDESDFEEFLNSEED